MFLNLGFFRGQRDRGFLQLFYELSSYFSLAENLALFEGRVGVSRGGYPLGAYFHHQHLRRTASSAHTHPPDLVSTIYTVDDAIQP
jgi:hypothetical protein